MGRRILVAAALALSLSSVMPAVSADPPATGSCSLLAPVVAAECQLLVAQPGTEYNALADYDPTTSKLRLYSARSLLVQTDPALSWKPDMPDLTLDVDRSTVPQGVYTAVWGSDPVSHARVVVSAMPGTPTSRILMMVPDYTYMAYNSTGGGSLYSRLGGSFRSIVAKDRPQAVRPLFHDPAVTPQAFIEAQAHTNIDVMLESELVSGQYRLNDYDLLVLYGHDEYWSSAIRDALSTSVNQGLDVLSLSGNTGYRTVVDDGTTITRIVSGTTTQFTDIDQQMLRLTHSRFLPPPTYFLISSRNMSAAKAVAKAKRHGMQKALTRKSAVARLSKVRVIRRGDPLLSGVAVDRFGYVVDGSSLLVGHEVDGIPVDARWRPLRNYLAFMDSDTQLIAGTFTGPNVNACATIIRSATGQGRVVSLGSMRWVEAMFDGDDVATRIAANALNELLPTTG